MDPRLVTQPGFAAQARRNKAFGGKIPSSAEYTMVISLDSPRWKTLDCACWKPEAIPDLIREIASEKTPNYHDNGAWFHVYSSIFHQSSIYSATYAALPHLVDIAETGNLLQRVAIMCLAGEIQIFGQSEGQIPADLLADFQAAMDTAKAFSLTVVRQASREATADSSGIRWVAGQTWSVADLLQAFGGLHYPTSGYVVQLGHMVRELWSVEACCPSCNEIMLAELRQDGILTLQISRGLRQTESAKVTLVDRSVYPKRIASGKDILARSPTTSALDEVPCVLSGLAYEVGDHVLATRILDLGTVVQCVYCDDRFRLTDGIQPLS